MAKQWTNQDQNWVTFFKPVNSSIARKFKNWYDYDELPALHSFLPMQLFVLEEISTRSLLKVFFSIRQTSHELEKEGIRLTSFSVKANIKVAWLVVIEYTRNLDSKPVEN